MNRILIAIAAATIGLAAVGCAPSVPAKNGSGTRADGNDETAAPAAAPVDAQTYERQSAAAGSGRTFLDTLNRGKEIALSPEDLPVIEVAPKPAAPAQTGETAGEPMFRIQILASSQVDMVRREMVKVEAEIALPAMIASEQSLFKLYVGEFKTRAEAEAALPEVKKKGYADAWIVTK